MSDFGIIAKDTKRENIMPKRKLLAFYNRNELRVEEKDGCWHASCELCLPQQRWDTWTERTLASAQRSALTTAQNRLPYPFLETVEWRDLSDMADEDWARGMTQRHHPQYPDA